MEMPNPELLANAVADLTQRYESKPHVVNMSGWVDKWGNYKNNAHEGCFGGLTANPYEANLLTVAAHPLHEDSKKAQPYIDWLINRSPYQDVFLNTDKADRILFTDPSQPANYMVAGLVATRYPHESSYMFEGWLAMVKAGISEDLAFLLMHCSNYYGRPGGDSIKFDRYGHSHHAISKEVTFNYAKNFLAHKLVQVRPAYVEKTKYYGFDALWTKDHLLDDDYLNREFKSKSLPEFLNTLAKEAGYPQQAKGQYDFSHKTHYLVPTGEFTGFIFKNLEKIMEKINA